MAAQMESLDRRITSDASALSGGNSFAARQEQKLQTEIVCYHPNAKIVSVVAFNDISSPTGSGSTPDTDHSSAWNSQLEQTIAVGPLQIYRAPASIAFLSCGAALQALFPKSQCWCLDSSGSKYILQIRPPHYWRIELPVGQVAEQQMAVAFQKSMKNILLFEKTRCPLRQDDNSRTATGQVAVVADTTPTKPIRSYPSTPNLAMKQDTNETAQVCLSDGSGNTLQNDANTEELTEGKALDCAERSPNNPGFRDETRLMKSLSTMNQANISKKRRSSSASPAKCMEQLTNSQNNTEELSTKQANGNPVSLLSGPKQSSHPLATQPLTEISNHTVTALLRHSETAAPHQRNAAQFQKLDLQAPPYENRSTALDGQMQEIRARHLQRPPKRRAHSVPDCPCLPMAAVDKTETKCSAGRLRIFESIYNTFTKLPRQLLSLMMRLAKTVAGVLWAAEPDAYAEFSHGNYVPEWDDSGGELSGFSEYEDDVVEERIRIRSAKGA